MDAGKQYTLPVNGTLVNGQKDDFLRRRTAAGILASALSSGCGDYAVAFISLVERCGLQTLLVDAAEISVQSLQSRFAGHAVVAVRDESNRQWILADPTNKRILAAPWAAGEKMFGGVYWIGFKGPVAEYPVHDASSLRKFYDRTLKTIPLDILNRQIIRLRFTIDASLMSTDGRFLNPNVSKLIENSERLLTEYGLQPQNEVIVRVVKGGDDARSDLRYSNENGWTLQLGLRSICSPGLLGYVERHIAGRMPTTK